MKFKEKLMDTLGAFQYIFQFISFLFPVVMIMVAFNLPWWCNLILIALLFLFSYIQVLYWIVGLIGAIIGPQDVIAIIYYISFAIMFVPFIISIIPIIFSKE